MSRFTIAVGTLLLLCWSSGIAGAQYFPNSPGTTENIEGIMVTGKGEAAAKPNLLEIDLQIAASAELTADAIVKYRDAKRRIREAFDNLKLENVTVTEEGLLVDNKGVTSNRYYGYPPPTQSKAEIELSRKMIVQVSNIREMEEEALVELIGRLLDVAKDAGANVGQTVDPYEYYYYGYRTPKAGLSRFVLSDYTELQEKAFTQAMEQARTRAARLARLSGSELGPVVAVREVVVPAMRSQSMPYRSDSNERDEERIVASKFENVPVRVELLVRFSLRPKAGNGQTTGE